MHGKIDVGLGWIMNREIRRRDLRTVSRRIQAQGPNSAIINRYSTASDVGKCLRGSGGNYVRTRLRIAADVGSLRQ